MSSQMRSAKDRHSKVCTAKGLRDRRVRLSAHTAIQFYDLQDRLGYDRPSKAIDWLIKNAKSAIDELAELPPWHPYSVEELSGEKPHQDPIFEHENHIQRQDYAFDVAPVAFGVGKFCAQRGPLQSSNMALLCPWMETIDEEMQQMVVNEVPSFGFCLPDGIHGEEVLDDGIYEKMASGFSASYYL